MSFLFGILVDLPAHHVKSKSLETLITSPNHWLFIRKLILAHAWCTRDKLLDQACTSNILPLSFFCLHFWKFANLLESSWNFAKMTEPVCVDAKTLFGFPITHLSAFVECLRFHIWSFHVLSVCYLCWFASSVILNQNHLKLSTHHRIIGFLLEN